MAPTHGKASTYAVYGCRCKECRAANTARMRRVRAELAQRPAWEIPHGVGGYRNYSCRCVVCTEANSAACAAYRAKTAAAADAPAATAETTPNP